MKIGFIGAGNMGGAILKGALKAGFLKSEDTMVFDLNEKLLSNWQIESGIVPAKSNAELAAKCEWIVLAIKPIFFNIVLSEIKPYLNSNKKIISIAAGWSLDMLNQELGECGSPVLRVMPNTPALVGAGLTAICQETTLSADDLNWAKSLFETLGMVQMIPERLIDAVIAVSGSSPAYVFMFIEAMADAAVKLGMFRPMAIESAAQAVMGAAKMVLDTHQHPAVLKDNVCSPGGTTIEAVQMLEKGGLRAAVMDAMVACAEKNQKMTQKGNK
ncbi:MAG: pyrroline-5-carboxylate reductase [Clostridia bacterium]|nr:pyrroline-5-carboxylate reductase [Clostridia bacterium]